MRKRNGMLSSIMVLLLIVCLTINTISMTSALSPHRLTTVPIVPYDLEVTILFSDDENSDVIHSTETYRANAFLFYVTETEEYLIATHDTVTGKYVFSTYTDKKSDATVFYGGMSAAEPNKVIITGLPADNYTMQQIESPDNYPIMQAPIDIEIHSDRAVIAGTEVHLMPENTVAFRIMLTPGQKLPACCDTTEEIQNIATLAGSAMLVITVIGLVFILRGHKSKKTDTTSDSTQVNTPNDTSSDNATYEMTDKVIDAEFSQDDTNPQE